MNEAADGSAGRSSEMGILAQDPPVSDLGSCQGPFAKGAEGYLDNGWHPLLVVEKGT